MALGGAAWPAAGGARGGSPAGAEPAERRSRWAEGQGRQPARPAAARGPLPAAILRARPLVSNGFLGRSTPRETGPALYGASLASSCSVHGC